MMSWDTLLNPFPTRFTNPPPFYYPKSLNRIYHHHRAVEAWCVSTLLYFTYLLTHKHDFYDIDSMASIPGRSAGGAETQTRIRGWRTGPDCGEEKGRNIDI